MRSRIAVLLVCVFVLAACNFPSSTDTPPPVTEAATLPPTLPPATEEAALTSQPIPATAESTMCLLGGDQNDIMDALHSESKAAVLCQKAVFELTGPVIYDAEGQKIYTVGQPTDDRRAILKIVSATLTTAVQMRDVVNAELSYVVVDGNRTELGSRQGDALIYAGGFSTGQVISHNVIRDTRSWSSLHLIEGAGLDDPCENALIEDNDVGPAGTSDDWADGISLACTESTVRNNRITDATDGGIVIFGAPGSIIEDNVVTAQTRVLLGGINLVDYTPYDGNFHGTVVRNNLIDAAGSVIRIGLGMGKPVWACVRANNNEVLYGATVIRNTLQGDFMQYGFLVDGVKYWTVADNVDNAKHTGIPSVDCHGSIASEPAGFQFNPDRAQGTFQPEFQDANLDLALWAIADPLPGE